MPDQDDMPGGGWFRFILIVILFAWFIYFASQR